MNEKVTAKNLATPFVILTMGITWILWWGIVIANQFGFLEYGTPMMMVLYMIGGNAPPIVAIFLVLKSRQMTFKNLIKTIFYFKQSIFLYIIVFGAAILTYLIPVVMNKATIIAPLYMSILMIPLMVIGGGLEEIGWRFLLQPALEKKASFVFATIITAIIWDFWHLPLFFMEGTNQFTWSFFAFAINVLGLSFILAAIFKVSKNIWLCILFHSVCNAIGSSVETESNIISSLVICSVLILVSFILMKILPKIIKSNKKS